MASGQRGDGAVVTSAVRAHAGPWAGTLVGMDDTTGSMTARIVAVGRAVGVGGRRDELVGAMLPSRDRLVAAAARRLGVGRGRDVHGWSGHPALRMLAVDAAVQEALDSTGASTMVVLGAGYDTRAWRLERLRGRRVIEVDHPATQADKRARLERAGTPAAVVADLVLAGADLAEDDLDEVLERADHDPSVPTVWLWEAVVAYLPADAVDATLEVLQERSAPGSRLLVTTVTPALFDPPVLGRGLARPARWIMARLGEPVRLAETDRAFAARLARHGFAQRRVTGPRQWARRAGLRLRGPHVDERLHVADRVLDHVADRVAER